MSTKNISWWGKGGQCVGDDCLEIWELQPTGTPRACPGLCRPGQATTDSFKL